MEIAPGRTIDVKMRFGKPVVKGTPVPVVLVLGKLAGGSKKQGLIPLAFFAFALFFLVWPGLASGDVFTDTKRSCLQSCVGQCCEERCGYVACVAGVMTREFYGFEQTDPGASGTAIAVCKPFAQVIEICVQQTTGGMHGDTRDPSRIRTDISGTWNGGGESTYVVTQSGNKISWEGRGSFAGRNWRHRAEGTLSGDKIQANYTDLRTAGFIPTKGRLRVKLHLMENPFPGAAPSIHWN